MMWQLQLLIETVSYMLAQDTILNGVFAYLALLAAFGRAPRICAVLTALVHLILMMP